VIHTDFTKGFIGAEVMGFQEFKELGEDGIDKLSKKARKEGKDYIV
jgi:ribosome-binding ATPase YchF (GTP1/OBG family)